MTSAESHQSDSTDPTLRCDDSITRCFLGATIFWGLIASLAGAFSALTMLMPEFRWTFGDNGEYLSFGRMRPVFTTIAVYAFAGNAAFTGIYYSTQRLCNRRMFSLVLGRLHFIGWQVMVLLSVFTIPRGLTQGKQFIEAEWPLDVGFALVWIVFFGTNLMMTVIKRREKLLYISLWFYIFAFVSIAVYQIGHLAVANLGQWSSDAAFAGTSDALLHSVFVQNTVWQLLIIPLLGMIYYFVPKASHRPIYSYKLAIVQFWGIVFCFCWIGPAQLHLTAISDFPSSLAMVFGLILWMPIWGGVINGLMTAQNRTETTKASAIAKHFDSDTTALKFMAIGVAFLGATAFFQSLLCIKSVSAVLNYTDWVSAQLDTSVFGACGMVALGMIYWLMPRLFSNQAISESLIKAHFWLATVGLLLTSITGYAAGLWQGLSLSSLSSDTGQLVELEFLNTLEQVSMLRWLRLAGLLTMGGGMLFMGINYLVIAVTHIGRCESSSVSASTSNEPRLAQVRSKFADAPMLEVAKNFEIWKHMGWHRAWERDAGKFVWLPLIVIAIATLFQVAPTLVFSSPTKIAQPYSPLELAGREIFIHEGCANCHTQVVRPLVAETKRFGEYSQLGEFAYDHPSQWGYRRVGPDLAREGGRQTSHWHWVHLRNPRDADWCDPRSVMPSFAYLSCEELVFDDLRDKVEAAQNLGADYPFSLADVPMVARQQAEQIAADVVGGGGPIWTERLDQPPLMVYDSKAIALIAYLQRLGTDLYRPAPSTNKIAQTNQ